MMLPSHLALKLLRITRRELFCGKSFAGSHLNMIFLKNLIQKLSNIFQEPITLLNVNINRTLDKVVHTFNPRSEMAETGRSLCVRIQTCIHSDCHNS